MEKVKVRTTLLGLFMLVNAAFNLAGQEKVEKEYGVDSDEVPLTAAKWILKAFPDVKVKWFFEETSGKKSYEAKLKWDDYDHSIEFDTTGILEDVEIKVEWEELSETAQSALNDSLNKEDKNYKVRKIQLQLTGKPDNIIQYLQGNIDVKIKLQYEIEYYSTTNDKFNLWEGLFSKEGKLISKRRVRMMATDNLDF